MLIAIEGHDHITISHRIDLLEPDMEKPCRMDRRIVPMYADVGLFHIVIGRELLTGMVDGRTFDIAR